MKQIKLYIALLLLCTTSLICYVGNYFLTEKQHDVFAKVNSLFNFSIKEDKSIRMYNIGAIVYRGYSNRCKNPLLSIVNENTVKTFSSSDTNKFSRISLQEKEDRLDHTFLQKKEPIQVHLLDSLFKTKLQENNISLKTEIQYIAYKDTAYSTKNRSFYETALPLEMILTGVLDEIRLQAFVKPPFLYQNSAIISTTTFFLFFISFGGLIWIFIRKKNEEEVFVVDETNLLPLSPSVETPEYIKQISDTTFFNKEKKALICNDETIYLTGARLTIFLLMMNDEDYFVQSATIKSQLWPKLDNVKDNFNKTMERLRADLKPIPELVVHHDRKRNGYYLKVVSVEEVI